jgi:penicillin-binding protein 2
VHLIPNLFVSGITSKAYGELRDSIDIPLLNRLISGEYPPGSTIKPHIALAGLEYGIVTPDYQIFDPGFFQLPGQTRHFRDWKKGGHGGGVNVLARHFPILRHLLLPTCTPHGHRPYA